MERDQLIESVKQQLDDIGHGFKFEVVEGGVRQDDEWWYVPVVATGPNGATPPREFLITTYANIEDELGQALGVNLLLIPAA